ncbi:sensor histidine kinase [Sporosarcina sp. Marseille-Q4063]|uniref:sensor histidine kinase n=1 Tax=Sporosarcina sp. Marseille-Q4063 TaxID=2810514 RepID=UPI001BB0ABA8|nr:sensor histidine kinase [Sporosarcina sp. Marseille-Q4063]QUW21557.1 sensor histidine kinase [Sporosarcina sp. Marseille-Q4063]
MLREKMKAFSRKNLFSSFSSTINAFYISIIIIFGGIIGWVSYVLATKQIEENSYESMHDTVLQTNNYIDFILTDVFEQLVLLSKDPKIAALDATDLDSRNSKLYVDVDDDIRAIYHRFNSIIDSIYIDIDDGKVSFYQGSQQINSEFPYEDYFTEFKGNKESFYWRNIHPNTVTTNPYDVISVFHLIESDDPAKQAIILFNLRADFFEKVFNKSLIGKNGYLTLISPDGTLQTKDVPQDYELDAKTVQALNQLAQKEGKYAFRNAHGEKMNAIYNTIGVNKWKVAAVFPENQILQTINNMKYLMLGLFLIVIIMATFIVNIVGKYISKPIEKLADEMTKVDREHLQLAEGLAVPKEMRILYSSFNEQMEKNAALLNQIELDQKEKRQLEVAIIQAQMNPHFLYNTLYSIKGLCDMGLNEDASEMISALSSFFRISISRGNEIISIEEEIDHIKSYLYIMEMRYGDDFSYTLDVDEKVLSSRIIKLTLQPLIENAIYHGVKLNRNQGFIDVKVLSVGDKIQLEVEDNGLGMSEERLSKIREEIDAPYNDNRKKYIGIGLRSVSERLKGYFGKTCELKIVSEVEKGTKITIIIPNVKGEIEDYG